MNPVPIAGAWAAPRRGSRPRLLFALAALTLCTSVHAQSAQSLPQVELKAGMHLIHAELADNERTRELGLMFRRELAPNHGMLFVFDEAAPHCMWMRNTLIGLSVAFLDDAGKIVNVEEMKPQTDDAHCARRPARYALEMEAQWFKRHGMDAGSPIRGVVKGR